MIIIKRKDKPPKRLFVEEPSDNLLWQLIHRIGDKYYPAIRDLMVNTWDRWRGQVDVPNLFDAILADNTTVAMSNIERAWMVAENEMLTEAKPIITDLVQEAYAETVPRINEQISAVFQPGMSRQVEAWAQDHVGQWITQIGETERQSIRNVILEEMGQGRGPAVIARNIKQFIGMTDQQAKAVMRQRATMEAAGIKADKIDKAIDKLIARKIKERAMVIARNESILASKQGNRQAYLDGIYQGAIDPDEARRFWVITPVDACQICLPIPGMNPEGRRLDEPFLTPIGNLMIPHAHIQCRCVEIVKL